MISQPTAFHLKDSLNDLKVWEPCIDALYTESSEKQSLHNPETSETETEVYSSMAYEAQPKQT